jgi:branched-chain amino acid transport system substrate-binding protein
VALLGVLHAGKVKAPSVTIAVEVPVFDWFPDTSLFVDAVELALDERGGQVCGGWSVNVELSNHAGAEEFVDLATVRYNTRKNVAKRSVGAVLGPYTSTSAFVMLPIANKAGLLVVSPANAYECLTSPALGCADDFYPKGTRNYARTIAHHGSTAARQADLAGTILTTNRTVIYVYRIDDDGHEYGGALARAFAAQAPAAGVTLIETMPYSDHFFDPPNFPDKVTRILAANPGLVVYAGNDEGFEFVTELRARGYLGEIFVGDGIFEQRERFLAEVGAAAEGIYATIGGHVPESYDHPLPGVGFADVFTAWAGQPPRHNTAEAYLAAHVILDAFDAACAGGHLPTDRGAVIAAALAPKVRTSPYFGDYSLDSLGDRVSGPTAVYRVIGGTFVYQTSVR